MYNSVKSRYQKTWITDSQLDRYVLLGAITDIQAKEIREAK